MPSWLLTLLREQQAAGFPDIAGANGFVILPVSDRLLSRVIAARLPPSVPVSDLEIRADEGNQLVVRARLTRAAFLPPVKVRLVIEKQPQLPASPILVLRLVSEGLAALAGTVLKFVEVLPRGIRLDGDKLSIDLAVLAEQYGAADALAYLTDLEIATSAGRVVLTARAAVPPAR
jgi:hypothetical protein